MLFIPVKKSATLATMSKYLNSTLSKVSADKLASHTPSAPAPSHLPDSMISSVRLLPENERLILFTRHSLRERSDGNGFASYQLPLTPKGRVLAKSWGRWFQEMCLVNAPLEILTNGWRYQWMEGPADRRTYRRTKPLTELRVCN